MFIIENTLLIKKNSFQICFLFDLFLKTFLLSQSNMFFFIFKNKNCFPKFRFQIQFFFLKTSKIILKNYF